MDDYQKTITVDNSAHEVYRALTQHIAGWWSDDLSGASSKTGDQFNIAFGETKKTFEITGAIPDKQVTWLCLKAYIDMHQLQRKDEWVDTRIIWTITNDNGATNLSMLHQGLNKSVECYDVCEPAWDYFMASIEAYLTTGAGTPIVKKMRNWSGKSESLLFPTLHCPFRYSC
jgi:hypothetical protein